MSRFPADRLQTITEPVIRCAITIIQVVIDVSRVVEISTPTKASIITDLANEALALDGKLISFPIQLLLQNPPGQLKFKSIALPAMWLLLLDPPLGMCFLKELVINNCKKKIRDEMNHSINK